MTETSSQHDWMTELLASNPEIGRLVWFTVNDGPVNQTQWLQAAVQAGLAVYGTPAGIPANTAYLRGLRALQQATPTRTLIRRVEQEHGRTVHHWIEETVSGGHVHFRVLAALERRAKQDVLMTHPLDTLTAAESDALSRLPELVDTARHTYTPGDRRRQVRQWLAAVGALQMAAAGPMQFVPDTATGLIDALTRAQDDLGVHVWSMPLQRSQDVVTTLTASLDAEITKKTAALLKTVQTTREAGKTPTTGQQAKLVSQLHDLDTRVQRYAELFGWQLDNLTMQLDIARKTVRRALEG